MGCTDPGPGAEQPASASTRLQYLNERLLGNVDPANGLDFLLPFFLLLQKFAFAVMGSSEELSGFRVIISTTRP